MVGYIVVLAVVALILAVFVLSVYDSYRIKHAQEKKLREEREKEWLRNKDEEARIRTLERQKEEERKEIEKQNERIKKNFWLNLSGIEFEQELGKVFIRQGYEVHWTPTSGDQGIDLILKKDGKTLIVQCKAYKIPASPSIVRELYGVLMSCKADEAILASLGGFTAGVRMFIVGKPIRLLDLDEIIRISSFIVLPTNSTIPPPS